MNLTLTIALISAGAAILGALFGSIAPAIVTWLNSRAETRRELLRLAVQLATIDQAHLLEQASVEANRAGQLMTVPPISVTFLYHLEVLELAKKGGHRLKPETLVALRQRVNERHDALIKAPYKP